MSLCSKTSLPYATHFTTEYPVCQHPAQKKFFGFGQIDKGHNMEYNGSNEQRRSWQGRFAPIRGRFSHNRGNLSPFCYNSRILCMDRL